MNPRDFAFWLQGFYELNISCGKDYQFTVEQIKLILKHIELVKAYMRDRKKIRSGDYTHDKAQFVFWLEGVLAASGSNVYQLVQTRLSHLFEHVIDKEISGDQDEFNSIHGSAPDGELYRC